MAVKSKEQREKEADIARRAAVDAANKKTAKALSDKEAAEANIALNNEEKAFIARVASKMNEGRAIARPSAADITRYARLIKRKGVK